jgi:heat shock protein HtpX
MNGHVHRRHRLLNFVHTALLVAGSLALFIACAWVFFGTDGIIYALGFGAVSLFMAGSVSPAMVLRMYKAHPVSPHEFPAGHAILDRLAERAELPARPQLFVLPSEMMNAFAVGRMNDSAICLTDKLIRSLTQRELAGVMAHEVSHIRNEDVRVMAIADMVSRFTSVLSTLGIFTLLFNLPSIVFGSAGQVPWIAILLLLFAPTIGGLLQLALSRTREYDADFGAVMLTGDPDGLASALLKLEKAQRGYWEGMVLPGSRLPEPSILRTHPKTADRIERLMAMKETEEAPLPGENGQLPTQHGRVSRPAARSPVPRVGRPWGREQGAAYSDYASLYSSPASAPIVAEADCDKAACEQSLNPPRGKPRIRLPGVYW